MKKYIVLALIVITGMSCGSKLSKNSTLFWGNWVLIELDKNPVQLSGTDRDAGIEFKYDDMLVSGRGGCNSFRGNFAADGKKMEFGELATTRMMCPDQAFEDKYFKIIRDVKLYSIEDQKLYFRNNNKTVLAVFKHR